jgi:hypothetical protein
VISAHLPDVTRAAAEPQQVVFENLDRVKAGGRDGTQLFVQRTAQ